MRNLRLGIFGAAIFWPLLLGADGLGINVPVVGRLVGAGNTLFITSIDVSNNTGAVVGVDFYFDAVDVVTQDRIVIDGSVGNTGLTTKGAGTVRGYSNVHFDDFIDDLVRAGMLSGAARDRGVLGSVLLVFNGLSNRGQATASARFYNDFGGGTVGVALSGNDITGNEPKSLVATVRDTRGRPGVQLYTNMFINNIGLTPAGIGTADSVTVELTARSSSTGQPIGVPILLENIGPGLTRSISSVLTALQIQNGTEDTILVFARVKSGNSAIAGITSTVDATTRDGSVVAMARAE
jgi:hypothetical protein